MGAIRASAHAGPMHPVRATVLAGAMPLFLGAFLAD